MNRADQSGGEAPGGGSSIRPFVMLGLLAFVELLGMAGWFAGGAVGTELGLRWSLTQGEVAWLTSSVQLGFVAGTLTAAILNLPDLIPGRWYVASAAAAAGVLNAGLLLAPGYQVALLTRFALGFALAGVYPPAMKMAATWFQSRRGLAIGAVVGALTVGKALPYLVEALGGLGVNAVVGSTSLAALVAAAIVAVAYRDGPYPFPRRPFSWSLVAEVARVRELRLVTTGYLGHMWELYAYWGFIAAYWSASLQAQGAEPSPRLVPLLTFCSIAIGAVGCLWGGLAADRIGRGKVVLVSLAVSGTCALAAGLVFGGPLWLVLPVIFIWGVAVIADSAQFSALVTELAPPHAVGTALTLQTSIGFLLTMFAIQFVAAVGGPATRWAFPALSLGPLAGIVAIRALQRLKRVEQPA